MVDLLVLCFQIHNRSSVYSSESRVRKAGSFIYEEFMPTDGTDVKVRGFRVLVTVQCRIVLSFLLPPVTKSFLGQFVLVRFLCQVYTVGLDYAHAEARKSPALDGKVERDSEGKEVRYPVILTNAEKLIARRVCQSFNQMVCGFDLLR